MTRKIALCTVARTSSCGVRMNLRTVRRATARALGQNPAPAVPRARTGLGDGTVSTKEPAGSVMAVLSVLGGLGAGCRVGAVGRGAGDGEEDLIERGAPQRDVLDRDAEVIKGAHGLHQSVGAVHRDGG